MRRSRIAFGLGLLALACNGASTPGADHFARAREEMVKDALQAEGISDARVLAAMERVPRHEFVPEGVRAYAYENRPLPIGEGQTISQPFVVAYMIEQLRLQGHEKVLEIGTGSGYEAAVLGELSRDVYTIEIVSSLASRARTVLANLGYENVHVREGDGYAGWPEQAPFDAIILSAAPGHVPQPLVDQLAEGGVMILPLGESFQELVKIERRAEGLQRERLLGVRFVPMTGQAQQPR